MTPRLFIVPLALNRALWIGTAAIAVWKGGWRERLIALVWAGGAAITVAFPVFRITSNHVAVGGEALATDLAALVAAVACLRGARRYWVILATAFALLEVVTDVIYMAAPSVSEYAFASADRIWGYALEAVIVWASLTHRRADPQAD